MARNQHTFAKRQREIEKKRKAEEKREKRRRRKELGSADANPQDPGDGLAPEPTADASASGEAPTADDGVNPRPDANTA